MLEIEGKTRNDLPYSRWTSITISYSDLFWCIAHSQIHAWGIPAKAFGGASWLCTKALALLPLGSWWKAPMGDEDEEGEGEGEEEEEKTTETKHKQEGKEMNISEGEGLRGFLPHSTRVTRGLCVDWGSLSTRTPLRHWSQRPGSSSPEPQLSGVVSPKAPNPLRPFWWPCTDFGCFWWLIPGWWLKTGLCYISYIKVVACGWRIMVRWTHLLPYVFVQKSKIAQDRNFGKTCFYHQFWEVSPCSFSDQRHILLPQACPWPEASFQRLVKEILTDLQAQMRQPDRDLLEMEENAAGFWVSFARSS